MYSLRYYCQDDAYWNLRAKQDPTSFEHHKARLDLLTRIQQVHGITYELSILPTTAEGWTDEATENTYYREHIVPRAHILIPRLKEKSLRRAFRSRSGNLYLAGIVAILENGEVGWATGTNASFEHFASPSAGPYRPDCLYFLEAVLNQGSRLLAQLCFPVEGTPEQQLLDRFKQSSTLNGHFQSNVWLPAMKQIDLICDDGNVLWIIEGKMILNWEAYGQIRGYSKLYQMAHPDKKVRSAIVCAKSDSVIEQLCHEDGITVYVDTGSEFHSQV